MYVTIQKTDKTVKVLQLLGLSIFLFSLWVLLANPADLRPLGGLLFWLGFGLMFLARVIRWWRND